MKITKEQLRNINVEAYISFIEKEYKEIEIEYISLPFFEKQYNDLHLKKWDWYSYYLQNNKSSIWYKRYENLLETKCNTLEAQIEKSKKTLVGAILLVNPELIATIFKDEQRNKYLKFAENIDFKEAEIELIENRHIFECSIEADLEAINHRLQFDKDAINRELEKAENEDFKFLELVLNGKITRQYIHNSDVVFEFARLAFLHKLASGECNTIETTESPIKWIGKTAHLGYFMGLFADLGYIEAPKKKNGEINYNEFARQIAKVFDFEGGSIQYLAKTLNPDSNTMEYENKDKIQIPHIKELS